MLRAAGLVLSLLALSVPAAGLPVCYGFTCADASAACAPAQPTLVACSADAGVTITGGPHPFVSLDCWAGAGQGFDPQPAATAIGEWCAFDSSETPAIVGVPGVMLTYDGANACAYLFTNYAFGFRLFCLPPA